MAEIAIIGADIQEVLGSAIALQILFSIPLWGGVLITIADTFIILLIHHYGIKKLEIVFAFLLLIMFLCFLVNLILIKPIVGDLFEGIFVPTIPSGSLNAASGLVGCIIMPHNLFLHSSLVKTKKFDNQDQLKTGLRYMKGELALSLVFSFIINATVISTFAYFANFDEEISLSNAGDYLSRTFGSGGKYVWAIGLLASGQSATVTGTLAGQFIMTVRKNIFYLIIFIFYF